MTSRADGNYPGTIVSAYVAEDSYDPGKYVLKVDVNLEGGGAVTCRQQLKESEAEKRGNVLRALGLTWPFNSGDLGELKGKVTDVNLHTSKKGNQNAYIATRKEDRALTPDELDAMMAGQIANDNIPF